MRESNDEVEENVVRIIEPGKYIEVGDVSEVGKDASQRP